MIHMDSELNQSLAVRVEAINDMYCQWQKKTSVNLSAKIEVDQGWRRKVDWIRLCQNFFLSPSRPLFLSCWKFFGQLNFLTPGCYTLKRRLFFPKVLRISALLYNYLYSYIVFSRGKLSHAEQNILFGDLEKSHILKLGGLDLKFMQLAFSRI